jgi:hypothetical protein
MCFATRWPQICSGKGCTLDEIGELLRHQSPDTTAIYAKVDVAALHTLALPWPGGGR